MQYKQAPCTAILRKSGNGRHVRICAWAETLHTYGFSIQIYGKGGHDLILRHELKI